MMMTTPKIAQRMSHVEVEARESVKKSEDVEVTLLKDGNTILKDGISAVVQSLTTRTPGTMTLLQKRLRMSLR